MAAGAISAPLIIPISEGVTRKPKTRIDTRTPVCIQSGVLIFFTLDGSKPVAGQRGSEVGSRKYTGPILLPAGRVSVRAVAVSSLPLPFRPVCSVLSSVWRSSSSGTQAAPCWERTGTALVHRPAAAGWSGRTDRLSCCLSCCRVLPVAAWFPSTLRPVGPARRPQMGPGPASPCR
uniref:Uncharacterized protein n=1 Tax=Poecilia mexicana TaxID=48701 RepID=A0A3B3X826_9TELE